jgi:hypothetical protein
MVFFLASKKQRENKRSSCIFYYEKYKMTSIIQPTSARSSNLGDALVGGNQLGGSTIITGATGTVNLSSLGRIDDLYHVTNVAATTVLLPAGTSRGYKATIINAPTSPSAVTIKDSTNTITVGDSLSPGSSVRVLQTGSGVEAWTPVSNSTTSAFRIATFSATSNGSGNGTLDISSLALSTAPKFVSISAYSPANDTYTGSLKSKTATTITFETWDNLIGILIGGVTAQKQPNVNVDILVVY